jgi:hypothetical protein
MMRAPENAGAAGICVRRLFSAFFSDCSTNIKRFAPTLAGI